MKEIRAQRSQIQFSLSLSLQDYQYLKPAFGFKLTDAICACVL